MHHVFDMCLYLTDTKIANFLEVRLLTSQKSPEKSEFGSENASGLWSQYTVGRSIRYDTKDIVEENRS